MEVHVFEKYKVHCFVRDGYVNTADVDSEWTEIMYGGELLFYVSKLFRSSNVTEFRCKDNEIYVSEFCATLGEYTDTIIEITRHH